MPANSRIDVIQRAIDLTLEARQSPLVLEAGCGSASNFHFTPDTCLVGLDISLRQLERNADLHECVVGDVESHDFGARRFDIIICWDVLEHLDRPEEAVKNFLRWVKPDGLVILGFPNVYSLKGLVTKFTPLAFHLFYYRVIRGLPLAGTEDRAPFKTYLRASMAPRELLRLAELEGADLECTVSDNAVLPQRWLARIFGSCDRLLRLMTLGRFGDSECGLVLRRRMAAVPQAQPAGSLLSRAAG